jgi:hypothetical protein
MKANKPSVNNATLRNASWHFEVQTKKLEARLGECQGCKNKAPAQMN